MTDFDIYRLVVVSSLVISVVSVAYIWMPSTKGRKKLFEADVEGLRLAVEDLNLVANACADRSAEFYRRYQLEADGEDLTLSNALHEVVNDLKRVEDKMKPGSVLSTILGSRVAKEPGYWASLFGRKGRESNGSNQTRLANSVAEDDWAIEKEEEMAL